MMEKYQRAFINQESKLADELAAIGHREKSRGHLTLAKRHFVESAQIQHDLAMDEFKPAFERMVYAENALVLLGQIPDEKTNGLLIQWMEEFIKSGNCTALLVEEWQKMKQKILENPVFNEF